MYLNNLKFVLSEVIMCDFTMYSPLTLKEIEDPHKVLEDFFLSYKPEECRKALWKWLRLTIGGDFSSLESNERSDLISFYENLQKLLEATYLLRKGDGG